MGHQRPPKVRDKMYWQGQVIGLHTFGVLQSHRRPVVIHQHMCWNVSPSLNIVSVRVQLMHDSFSLAHAEGRCWLVPQIRKPVLVAALIYINGNLTAKE